MKRLIASTGLVVGLYVLVTTHAASVAAPNAPCALQELSPTEVKELKEEISRYLDKKAGPAPKLQPRPGKNVDSWCLEQYDAAAKLKNPKLVYQLIHGHLPIAERFLQSPKKQDKQMGLDIVSIAAYRAIELVQDKWLAPALAEAYLLPNFDAANEREGQGLSKFSLLQDVAWVYKQVGETEKYIEIYKRMLAGSDSDNTMDACRVRLAVALEKLGKYEEALRHLKEIDPKGGLSGSRADLIPIMEKKLKEQKTQKKDAPK
jgi:tetratricopeptide (TPR) repeat protein